MASLIGKALVKKTLRDTAHKNINSKNPYEEEIPVYGKNGVDTGKVKKRKRPIPPELSAHDGAVLKKVRRRAYRLDMSLFNCCGIRFGWSSVIGIIPVIGDAIDALMALMVVRTCGKIEGGLPSTLRMRMLFNIMLDFGIGLVPFVGDIADALYRANTRNAWLLEVYLQKKAEAERTGDLSDTELGTQLMPVRPEPARVGSTTPAQPVRALPSDLQGEYRSATNGKIRRPDKEMATTVLQYGVDAVRSHANERYGIPGGQQQPQKGGKTMRTRDDLARAALQYGAREAIGAYDKRRANAVAAARG